MNFMKTALLSTLLSFGLFLAGPFQTATADEPRQMTLFIWSEYMDPTIITDFEKTHNAQIRLDYYESNEEMIAKLQSGRQGVYDLIVPSTYFMPSLLSLGLIQPLNHELLPNIKNLSPEFTAYEADPGNKYTVPYQWGTSGIVVRASDINSVNPSWDLLFNENVNQSNFLLFDTARDALGSALKFLGYSANTTNLKEIEQAGNLLIKTKNRPTFMGFDSGVGGLSKVSGQVATIAQVYSGDAIRASLEDPEVHYIIPKEGCEIWLDLLAIPTGAAHIELAHEFLNYLMEPEVAAKLATFNSYATPNEAALAFIPKEDLDNQGMYPSNELKKNMEYFKDLGSNNRLYDETWTLVKSR